MTIKEVYTFWNRQDTANLAVRGTPQLYQPQTEPIPQFGLYQFPYKDPEYLIRGDILVQASFIPEQENSDNVNSPQTYERSSHSILSWPSLKTIRLFSTPRPVISTSTESLSLRNCRGVWNAPTPAAVPVITIVYAGIVVPNQKKRNTNYYAILLIVLINGGV